MSCQCMLLKFETGSITIQASNWIGTRFLCGGGVHLKAIDSLWRFLASILSSRAPQGFWHQRN